MGMSISDLWARQQTRFRHFLDHFQPPDSLVLVITAVLVGLSTGAAAMLFIWMLGLLHDFTGWVQGIIGVAPGLLLVMGTAGLLVGTIVSRWAMEAEGGGIPEVMEAVALRGGRIRPRVGPLKLIASWLTIGSGGSAGREGPMVQVGAALGSALGQLLHFPTPRIRTLVACGAAGGVSAAFNAPIAGSLFALEVVLGKFTVRYFGAVVISAVTADVIAHLYLGNEPAFPVPTYSYRLGELPLYVLLGILAALTAVLFVHVLQKLGDQARRSGIPLPLRAMLGMLLTAAIGLALPNQAILGDGLAYIGSAIARDFSLSVWFLLILLALKIIATALTIGAGNSGGVFAPSLFVGATLGGIVGAAGHALWPELVTEPGAYAIVGMAAVFSGAARAPITAVLIVFEMSNDYKLILPLMMATVLSTLLAEHLLDESIYSLKLKLKGISLHRGRDLDLMQSLMVGEAMTLEPYVVPHDMPLDELGALFRKTHRHSFPVVDDDLDLMGMVSLRDYEKAQERENAEELVVGDFATTGRLLIAYEDEPLSDAIRRLAVRGVSKMPVVSRDEPGRVLGVIRRSDIIRAYNVALARRVDEEQQMDPRLRPARHGGMRFMDLEIDEDSRAAGRTVASIADGLPYDCVVVSIQRQGTLLVPHGDTRLLPGDEVQVFLREAEEGQLRQCLLGEKEGRGEE
jgi:CIC family chloride channel protein